MTHGLGPGKPGPRAAKPITPPYVENNYRIEVKIIFMLITYLVLLCEFFWEFAIFHFCRPPVDIYWHPLLNLYKFFILCERKINQFAYIETGLCTIHFTSRGSNTDYHLVRTKICTTSMPPFFPSSLSSNPQPQPLSSPATLARNRHASYRNKQKFGGSM